MILLVLCLLSTPMFSHLTYGAKRNFLSLSTLTQQPWPLSKMPPPDREEFMAWIGSVSWDAVCKGVTESAVEFLKGKGVEKLGMIGFCWGANIVQSAAQVLMGRVAKSGVDQVGCCCWVVRVDFEINACLWHEEWEPESPQSMVGVG